MSQTPESTLANAIQSTCEETQPCEVKITFTVPGKIISEEENSVAQNITKQVRLPGFRPGHAPLAMVKSRHKENIEQEVGQHIISTAFHKVLKDSKYDVLSYNLIDPEKIKFVGGTDSVFAVMLSVAPEFQVPEYKNLDIQVETTPITDEQIASRIEHLRNAFAEFATVEDSLKKEDLARVDYTADVLLPEDAPASLKQLTTANQSWIWLSTNERIPGFNAVLEGKNAGDEFTTEITFDANFSEPFLSGKTISYKIKVLEAQRRVPLTNDAELSKRMQVEDIEALKKRLRADLEQEQELDKVEKNHQKVLDLLGAQVADFPLPSVLLEQEKRRQIRIIAHELVKSEEDAKVFASHREEHEKEAEAKAKVSLHNYLILRAIAKKEKITVTSDEMEQQIELMAHYLGHKPTEFRKLVSERGMEHEIQADLLQRKVTDFIATQKEEKKN